MVIELRGREKGGVESDRADKNEVSEKTERGERERARRRMRGRETKAFQRKGVS